MSAIKICSAVILHEHYIMVMMNSHSLISDEKLPWRLYNRNSAQNSFEKVVVQPLCSRQDSPPCAKSNIYRSSFQTQVSFSTKDIVQRSTKQENLVTKRLCNARVYMCHCNAVLVYTHSTYAIIF